MPFTVNDLNGKQQLRTASITDSLHDALNIMVEHDYSQLPVVGANHQLVGLVTSDSILRALDNNQATTANLSLTDTVIQIVDIDKETYRINADPFRLHEQLKRTGSVIIVDDHHCPLHIITNADMAEWLRTLAQDNILAADVENKLKQYITYAFHDSAGHLDREALDAAAAAAASYTIREAHSKFRKGLAHYLSQVGEKSARIEEMLLNAVLTQHYPASTRPINFNSLTFVITWVCSLTRADGNVTAKC